MNSSDPPNTLSVPKPAGEAGDVPETCPPASDFGVPLSDRDQDGGVPLTRATSDGLRPTPFTSMRPPAIPGYEILGELGRGGMGVVYKARQTDLKRLVAVKMIRTDRATREEIARFTAEAEAVARLQHPNIVQIYEVDEHEGTPFFSLEFVAGGSLDRHIGGKPQPARDSAALLHSVALAMQSAHERNIIHRDLKPANILLASEGIATLANATPKVTDFGLAKQLDDRSRQTASGAIMGTPAYMAPEQAEGRLEDVGPRADVYALGATLYECLTGRAPFTGTSVLDTLEQVRSQDPIPPSRLTPKLPRDLETICLKCLQKEPARRYASAAALADDLQRYLDGKPIRARPVSAWERTLKWARRRPAQAALVVALLLVVLASTAGALFYGLYQEQQANAVRDKEERSRQVLDLWARGQAAETARRYPEARDAYVQALAKLDSDATAAEELRDQIAAGRDRVLDKLGEQDARQKLAAERGDFQKSGKLFEEHRDRVLFHAVSFGARSAADDAVVRKEARQALAQLGLDADRPADFRTELGRWSRLVEAPERDRLTSECYEVLLTWAKVEEATAPKESQHLREVAAALEKAGRLDAPRLRSTLDLFQTALDSYLHNRVDEAASACAKVLEAEPRHFWAQYLHALCAMRATRWDLARERLASCLASRRGSARLLLLLGIVHGELGALHATKKDRTAAEKEYAVARDLLDRALKGADSAARRAAVLTSRGVVHIREGHWDDASKDLLQAIALQPKEYRYHVNLAQAYQGQGDLEKAVQELGRAIAIEGQPDATLHDMRARLQLKRGRPDLARSDFQSITELVPPGTRSTHLAGAYFELARLEHRAHRYNAALALCKKALEAVPDYLPACEQQATTLLAQKKFAEAGKVMDHYLNLMERDAKTLQALTEREPKTLEGLARAFQVRAAIHTELREHTLAVKACERSLALHCPDRKLDASTLSLRGWAYLALESPALALPDFVEAVRLGRKNAESLCGRGLARVQLVRPRGATAEAVAREVRTATADADEALRLVQQQGSATPEMRRRLLLNGARVHARAMGVLAAGGDRPVDGRLASRCEARALRLLDDTLTLVPEMERAAYWRTYVHGDPAFQSIRNSGGWFRRDQLHGR